MDMGQCDDVIAVTRVRGGARIDVRVRDRLFPFEDGSRRDLRNTLLGVPPFPPWSPRLDFFFHCVLAPLVLCVMRVRELVHTRSYDRTGGQKEWDVDDPKFTHDLKR